MNDDKLNALLSLAGVEDEDCFFDEIILCIIDFHDLFADAFYHNRTTLQKECGPSAREIYKQ